MMIRHASTHYAGSGESQVRAFVEAPFAYDPGEDETIRFIFEGDELIREQEALPGSGLL